MNKMSNNSTESTTYKLEPTIYDSDMHLFETKVGIDNKKMTLLYSAWGKTEIESKGRAESLVLHSGK